MKDLVQIGLQIGGWLMAMIMFMLLWCSARLWLQFFEFDSSEIEGNAGNRVAEHLLTALFVGWVVLNAGLLCWNAVWLSEGGMG